MSLARIPNVKLEASWKIQLLDEFEAPYMTSLRQFLKQQKQQNKIIYPKGNDIFRAFELSPYHLTKVVILGQDPYHGPNQAHGLSFSVPTGIRPPPSLTNIFKEIQNDLGIMPPKHGCLEYWARQGVLLLNSVLTVEQQLAASHQSKGWEQFTDRVIEVLNQRPKPIIFALWGNYAQQKGKLIDTRKHIVLKTTHPSPLSAHRGFLGCRHFSKINEHLQKIGSQPIDWRLPDVHSTKKTSRVSLVTS